MLELTADVFVTRRLRAREMSPGDIDFTAELLGDPSVMRFYPKVYSRAESREWIERQIQRYAQHGHGLWLVSDRTSNRPVGQVGLLTQEVEERLEREVAYLIHRPFWRLGYATEAAAGVCKLALSHRGATRLVSLIRPGNIPSQGVATRIGMVPEKRVMFRDLEHVVYSRGPAQHDV